VLDPRGAPPKKQFISGDQGVALDILDSLLQDDNVVEKDRLGNVGVPESLFRDVVIQSLPNHSERRSWHKFKKRLENKEFINIINGLVSKANV